ncbi:GL22999 [Drosophila persimilis]|uniref:GL22999 n=1 Tax=Drosophila persimilis TaxID=7234 RepID=B4G4I8_DROPE|nr:GL22999 [Drosophila persimilis]
MVWFVFLTYAWHWRDMGHVQDRIDKKGSNFHLVAWSLPLVLTTTTMAFCEVDGNSMVGICFVSYINHARWPADKTAEEWAESFREFIM